MIFKRVTQKKNNTDFTPIPSVPLSSTLSLHTLPVEEVSSKIEQLDAAKNAGFDGISPSVIKGCCDSLCLPSSLIFHIIRYGTHMVVYKNTLKF